MIPRFRATAASPAGRFLWWRSNGAGRWRRSKGPWFHVIEPIAQIIVSPYGGNPATIPNQDSTSFEFDDTNLFSVNRLPGYDIIEDGPRANVGIHYALNGPNNSGVDVLFGQNLRLKREVIFDPTTGFGDLRSDYVGHIRVTLGKYLDFTHRFRLDRQGFQVQPQRIHGARRHEKLLGAHLLPAVVGRDRRLGHRAAQRIFRHDAAQDRRQLVVRRLGAARPHQ